MVKFLVSGSIQKTEFQHKIEILVEGKFATTTLALTRAEAERKVRLILEKNHYKVGNVISQLI